MESSQENAGVQTGLSRIIDALPGMVWTALPDGQIDFFNRRWCEYTGLSMQEAKGWGWQRAVHAEDLPGLLAHCQGLLVSGSPGEAVARLRRFDGEMRWFMFRNVPLFDERGNLFKWYALIIDIDDQKRAEALLAGEKQLLEMIAKSNPLPSTLEALCKLVEETVGGYLCGIVLVDPTGTRLQHGAAPSLPQSYNEAIHGRPVNVDSGPCAMAVTLKEQVIAADVASDMRWDSYRWCPLAMEHGLRACWSTPILSTEGAALGAFALYSRQPGDPTARLQSVIEQMTHLAAVAIERQRAVDQLEASKELLDLAQKAARAIAFDWHIQHEVNVWSPELEALYGLTPGSFDGTYEGWKRLIHPPDWPLILKAIKHAQKTGEVAAEFRVVWPDGKMHWLATKGQMFFDEQGKPLRIVGFTSDATPRKLAEEELRRSEAFLTEAQSLSSTGSFSLRLATGEMTGSVELNRIFELDPPLTIDRIRTRVHPEDVNSFDKTLARARATGDDFECQYRLLMADHSVKYLRVFARATRNEDGALEYIVAVQDVTKNRLSQEALDKARSEFAHVSRVLTLGALTASIAHEVNQPLSGIITNANTCLRMLNADPPNVEGARETALRTIRDGHRASDVITRLRALFGKKDTATESMNLNDAALEVIALSHNELQRNRVILRLELADDLPFVTGDRVQLQQVILNLILNASEAMSEVDDRPRQLVIRTKRDEGDRVHLSVEDAGIGFERHAVDRLFEAFYTTKSGGMGIGLAVSRSIIEIHGGRLWASPNDGYGATFSFSIPCASEVVTGTDTSGAMPTACVTDAKRLMSSS